MDLQSRARRRRSRSLSVRGNPRHIARPRECAARPPVDFMYDRPHMTSLVRTAAPSFSVQSFVEPHVAQRVVLRLDLEDFFSTITLARVRAVFAGVGYPGAVAHKRRARRALSTSVTSAQSALTAGGADIARTQQSDSISPRSQAGRSCRSCGRQVHALRGRSRVLGRARLRTRFVHVHPARGRDRARRRRPRALSQDARHALRRTSATRGARGQPAHQCLAQRIRRGALRARLTKSRTASGLSRTPRRPHRVDRLDSSEARRTSPPTVRTHRLVGRALVHHSCFNAAPPASAGTHSSPQGETEP